jgi:hypothetical protein
MASKFGQIPAIENAAERSVAISNMVANSLDTQEHKDMLVWAVQEAQGLMFSRSVLNEFLLQLKKKDDDSRYDLLIDALNICSQRITAFEEQVLMDLLISRYL